VVAPGDLSGCSTQALDPPEEALVARLGVEGAARFVVMLGDGRARRGRRDACAAMSGR
jgi:hypothetical protein